MGGGDGEVSAAVAVIQDFSPIFITHSSEALNIDGTHDVAKHTTPLAGLHPCEVRWRVQSLCRIHCEFTRIKKYRIKRIALPL